MSEKKKPIEYTLDSFGTKIKVGNFVIYLGPRTRNLELGKVIKCCPQSVRVKHIPFPSPTGYDSECTRYSGQIVAVQAESLESNAELRAAILANS